MTPVFSFFKTLVNHEVTVELKNDISIRGTLKSVDQYLNIKLDDITVMEDIKYPHLVSSNLSGAYRGLVSASHGTARWRYSADTVSVGIMITDTRTRAPSRMSLSEAVLCDTFTSLPTPLIRHYSRMPPGEVRITLIPGIGHG